MAAANVTLTAVPQEFEVSNTTAFTATKSSAQLRGQLLNVGANDVYLGLNGVTIANADTGQQPNQIKIPKSLALSIQIPPGATFQFQSSTGASAIQWIPDN